MTQLAAAAPFTYSSASSHLLAAVLAGATGRAVVDYADEKLFDPLGVPRPTWATDPQGLNLGYGGLRLTAPDLLVIGTLFLRYGRWRGEELVPAAWIRQATTKPTPSPDFGYQWWTFSTNGHPAFEAAGGGGQLVEVVPDLRLVVAVTSSTGDVGAARSRRGSCKPWCQR